MPLGIYIEFCPALHHREIRETIPGGGTCSFGLANRMITSLGAVTDRPSLVSFSGLWRKSMLADSPTSFT